MAGCSHGAHIVFTRGSHPLVHELKVPDCWLWKNLVSEGKHRVGGKEGKHGGGERQGAVSH